MTEGTETFQLSDSAAETYERIFVPALFAEWAARLVDVAGISAGQRVLDVACGTGIVARTAADRLGGRGQVVGVDCNEGMLAVARRLRPELEWHRGDAADLPFPPSSFEAVLCQAALMYFPDRVAALQEMRRVASADGTVVVQVWGALDAQPAYRVFADVASRHIGDRATELISAYFSLGDHDLVADLMRRAGLAVTVSQTQLGTIRFGSIEQFVQGEIDGSPLADGLDAGTYARLMRACREELAEFIAPDGTTRLPIEGHIAAARST